jgi:hypothetical protein
MGSRNITFRGVCEAAGIAGLLAFVFGLGGSQEQEQGPSPIARLDDELSPMPALILAYEALPGNGGMLAGLGYLGDVAGDATVEPDPGAIATTDDVQAPLKVRRIEVIRADTGGAAANSLIAVTQNTKQRAKRANRAMPSLVNAVVKRFGAVIKQAGALHNVPAQLIATKICIENPDMNTTVVTGGQCTGLMQISPVTADNTLREEYKAGNLMPEEVAYFRGKLGVARWAALLAGRATHHVADLQNPAYCIHIGTLCFGQYLRKYTTKAGEVQIYKAAAEYNRGPRAAYANARCDTPDELIAFVGPGKTSTPAITEQYIMLYCGPGGPLDYLTANNILA